MTAPNGLALYVLTRASQTRAAMLDQAGRPVGAFLHTAHDARPSFGETLQAQAGRPAPALRGWFAMGEDGTALFVRGERPAALTEGARFDARIVSEARGDKTARAVVAEANAPGAAPLAAWRALFQAHTEIEDEPAAKDIITDAFDAARARTAPLPGGGALRVSRTEALTGLDVDTSGRARKGSAGAYALAVNREAAGEAARLLSLRGLGGLAALDCIAPLPRSAGGAVKTAFLDTMRTLRASGAEALAPSPFGLMELRLAHHTQDMAERLATPAGRWLDALWALEAEAQAEPMARLALDVPPALWEAPGFDTAGALAALNERYGARISFAPTDTDRFTTRPA